MSGVYNGFAFDDDQMKWIKLGKENNIDISIYAKPEFSAEQMGEIYHRLKEDLDVSEYIK